MSRSRDPRVDAYIANAAPFAKPILTHLRTLVHTGCPNVIETIKWSSPHFVHAGRNLCFMAGFKTHCGFGFWHPGMCELIGNGPAANDNAMGNFGRLNSRADLPSDKTMIQFVRQAALLNESGVPRRQRASESETKRNVPVPDELAAALKQNRMAAEAFAAFSPSHRREYSEWIAGAKREETRLRRVALALEWLAQGKPRHWQYR